MFVGVARVTLQIPDSGSLKAKRQILRRVTDRVKARFNVAVAEVDDNDLWQKATLALAVVGNDQRHVNEQLDKILHHIEDMYVAPVISRELEIIPLWDKLFAPERMEPALPYARDDRSLAEAEGLGDWDERHEQQEPPSRGLPRLQAGREQKKLSLDEARARARRLRNPRDWEKDR
jgi:uncharacterized protein